MAVNKLHDLATLCKLLAEDLQDTPTKEQMMTAGASDWSIRMAGGFNKILELAGLTSKKFHKEKPERRYKILVLDIELFPMEGYFWQMWDQNIGLDMMIQDWSVACWTAKWYGEDKHIFRSVRGQKDLRDDKQIIQEMRDLMDEADVILTQNGNSFDIKKITYRMIKHRIRPPARFLRLDTKITLKRVAKSSSNSLAFMSQEINEKYKKLSHAKYPGNKIFIECLKGNDDAWDEITTYNLYDVLATEEFYSIVAPFDTSINWNAYHHSTGNICFCGSTDFTMHPTKKKITRAGRYSLFICNDCGKDWHLRDNELTKDKRENMLR